MSDNTLVARAVEGAVVVGGFSALGAALSSIGVTKDSVLRYGTARKADAVLVTAHGPDSELARARTMRVVADPSSLESHHAACSRLLG
jgi:hypothetical protein